MALPLTGQVALGKSPLSLSFLICKGGIATLLSRVVVSGSVMGSTLTPHLAGSKQTLDHGQWSARRPRLLRWEVHMRAVGGHRPLRDAHSLSWGAESQALRLNS